jgi:hypothetical protein
MPYSLVLLGLQEILDHKETKEMLGLKVFKV